MLSSCLSVCNCRLIIGCSVVIFSRLLVSKAKSLHKTFPAWRKWNCFTVLNYSHILGASCVQHSEFIVCFLMMNEHTCIDFSHHHIIMSKPRYSSWLIWSGREGARVDFICQLWLSCKEFNLPETFYVKQQHNTAGMVLGDRSLWEGGACSVSCLSKDWCSNILFMTKKQVYTLIWTLNTSSE